MPAEEARIPATDEGLLRGDGVFEVIRLYRGRPFALDDHLERMRRSADNLRLPLDLDAVRADVDALLAQADEVDAALRVLCTRGGLRLGIVEPLKPRPAQLAGHRDLRPVADPRRRQVALLRGQHARRPPRRRARGRRGAARHAARPRARGPTNSFFCSFDGETLVTPPLEDHILDSITRRRWSSPRPARRRSRARRPAPGRARRSWPPRSSRCTRPRDRRDGAARRRPGPLTPGGRGRAARPHRGRAGGVAAR